MNRVSEPVILNSGINTRLYILTFLHASINLYMSLYVFFRQNEQYDRFYIMLAGFTYIPWIFFDGECIFSDLEKKAIDPNYVSGSDTTRHPYYDMITCGSKTGKSVYTFVILTLGLYNVFYMLNIYKIPYFIVAVVMGSLLYVILKPRFFTKKEVADA